MEENGTVAVDLDGCHNPDSGDIEPEADSIIDRCDSYTEVSPSGTGIRIFLRGKLPANRKRQAPWKRDGIDKAEIEVAGSGKYMTVTGHHIEGTPRTIEERQEAIEWLFSKYFPVALEIVAPQPSKPLSLTDAELLDKIRASKQGAKFDYLWSGGSASDNASSNDAALCAILAFWTRHDTARIDSLFRQSGLMRPKWDEKRGAVTYGEHTILSALSLNSETYDPQSTLSKDAQPAAPIATPNGATDSPLIETRPEFPISNLFEIFERPRALWLIQGMLLDMGYSAITGDYGTFKSFIALDMGLCIATGIAWQGREVKQGTVVYVVAEGAYTTADRAKAWLIRHQLLVPQNFHVIEMPVRIGEALVCARFIEAIRALEPSFIVLDTLAKCNVGKDENSAADMGLFTDGMEKCARELKAQVMTIHHNNKQGGSRGSNSLPSNVDTHITLKASAGYVVTIECEKQKGAPFERFALMGHVVDLGELDEYGTPVTSLVFAPTGSTPEAQAVTSAIGKAEKTRAQILKILQTIEGGTTNQKWMDACSHLAQRRSFISHRDSLEVEEKVHRTGKIWRFGPAPNELDLEESAKSAKSAKTEEIAQIAQGVTEPAKSANCANGCNPLHELHTFQGDTESEGDTDEGEDF